VHGITEAPDRVSIMERNLSFEDDPEGFRAKWMPREHELSQEIERAREVVESVSYSSRDLLSIAGLTSSLQVDGHRADLVILKAARAQAALEDRLAINDHDIALAAELALPHRLRRGPFQQAEVSLYNLEERIEQIHADLQNGEEGEPRTPEQELASAVKKKMN